MYDRPHTHGLILDRPVSCFPCFVVQMKRYLTLPCTAHKRVYVWVSFVPTTCTISPVQCCFEVLEYLQIIPHDLSP